MGRTVRGMIMRVDDLHARLRRTRGGDGARGDARRGARHVGPVAIGDTGRMGGEDVDGVDVRGADAAAASGVVVMMVHRVRRTLCGIRGIGARSGRCRGGVDLFDGVRWRPRPNAARASTLQLSEGHHSRASLFGVPRTPFSTAHENNLG